MAKVKERKTPFREIFHALSVLFLSLITLISSISPFTKSINASPVIEEDIK